jgi:putative transposase
MTEQQRLNKNQSIKQSIKATHDKRKNQVCSVYKVKIQENKLSKKQKEELKMLFVEAKWIYNDALNDVFNYISGRTVNVKNKEGEIELRELKYLGSQMKQSIISNLKSSIKTLSTLKKKGKKVGRLKYISDYKSIDLKQYKTTYQIISSKRMKVQKIHGSLPVNGLKQVLNKDLEFSNAKILNTPKGYYIAITIYKDKEEKTYKENIGIDLGIKTHITTSDGRKFNSTIEETERLKKLQRNLNKKKKGSNNRRKHIKLIQKEYQNLTNKKNDSANKITAELLKHKTIYMQDEQLNNWKIQFGKTIQHSILGRVKANLIASKRVVVLDKFEPTTQLCPKCLSKNKLSLSERKYKCSCGYEEDRDIHAAKNMILIGQELTEFKPAEMKTLEATRIKSGLIDETGRSQLSSCD